MRRFLALVLVPAAALAQDGYSDLSRTEPRPAVYGVTTPPVAAPASAPVPPDRTPEAIAQHVRDVQALAGAAPANPVAAEVERRALQAGATFAPTPGNLGSEGCTAAISTYVLPGAAQRLGVAIPAFTSSAALLKWVRAQRPPVADVYRVSIDRLTAADLRPGDVVVGQKSDGNHAMVWTRVPASWGWNPAALMAIGNTGLAQFGAPAMRLAQEYIAPGLLPGEAEHNGHHGMVNSRQATNPYRVRGGSTFAIIRFRNPDGSPSADGAPPHAERSR